MLFKRGVKMAKEDGLVEKKYRKNGGYSIRWNSLNNLINNMMTIELVSALKSRFFGQDTEVYCYKDEINIYLGGI